jgi:hypothetical protein
MLFPTFAKIAQDNDLTLSTAASGLCPWQEHVFLDPSVSDLLRSRYDQCTAMKRDLYQRVIPELKPDVIVLVTLDYSDPMYHGVISDKNGKPIRAANSAEYRRLLETDTERSLETLRTTASKVVLIENLPISTPDDDPAICITKSKVLEDCAFVANAEPTGEETIYRGLVDNRTTYVADFDRLLCPFMPICDAIVNGQVVRFDYGHITAPFALTIADTVHDTLRDAGVFRG